MGNIPALVGIISALVDSLLLVLRCLLLAGCSSELVVYLVILSTLLLLVEASLMVDKAL